MIRRNRGRSKIMNPEMAKELFIRINIICGTFGNTSVLPADVLKKFKSKYLQ